MTTSGEKTGNDSVAGYQTYLAFLCDLLQKHNRQQVTITESTGLVTDMGLSSLEVMELIEQTEDHFDISIPLNILPDVNTVSDLAQKIQQLKD
ncbi:MAG: acyl carrier protein [Chromatocurvus sp.]